MTQRNRRERLEPANGIVMDLGGYDVVAGHLNKSVHTIYGWAWSHEYKGCGGYIPRWWHDALIEFGHSKGVAIPRERFSLPPDDYKAVAEAKAQAREQQWAGGAADLRKAS